MIERVEPLTAKEHGIKAISDLIDCALDGRLQAVLDEHDALRAQLDAANARMEKLQGAAASFVEYVNGHAMDERSLYGDWQALRIQCHKMFATLAALDGEDEP